MRDSGFSRVAATVLVLALTSFAPSAAHGQIAVIVSRNNPLQSVSSAELKRLFLGSTKSFSDRTPVTIVEQTQLRQPFYRAVLGLSDLQIKRHWIQLVFSGEIVTPPSQIADAAELRRYVASHPGAIGFISLDAVDASVKTLAIDGHSPSDPAYKIR